MAGKDQHLSKHLLNMCIFLSYNLVWKGVSKKYFMLLLRYCRWQDLVLPWGPWPILRWQKGLRTWRNEPVSGRPHHPVLCSGVGSLTAQGLPEFTVWLKCCVMTFSLSLGTRGATKALEAPFPKGPQPPGLGAPNAFAKLSYFSYFIAQKVRRLG